MKESIYIYPGGVRLILCTILWSQHYSFSCLLNIFYLYRYMVIIFQCHITGTSDVLLSLRLIGIILMKLSWIYDRFKWKKKPSKKCIMKWLVWTMILFCYKKFKIFTFYLSLHGLRNLFNRHLILTIRSPDYHSSGISAATVKHLISRILVNNKFVDNSDVVGASPIGAAPTTSSFST